MTRGTCPQRIECNFADCRDIKACRQRPLVFTFFWLLQASFGVKPRDKSVPCRIVRRHLTISCVVSRNAVIVLNHAPTVETTVVNAWFMANRSVTKLTTFVSSLKTIAYYSAENGQIGKTGFEPATPWSQTKCSTKLSYFPKCDCSKNRT